MKQAFCKELEEAVRTYYLPHRDKNIRMVRFICDDEGDPMLLVRFVDERGVRMSALMSYIRNYGDYEDAFDVKEEYAVVRGDEQKLLDWYMNGEACHGAEALDEGEVF